MAPNNYPATKSIRDINRGSRAMAAFGRALYLGARHGVRGCCRPRVISSWRYHSRQRHESGGGDGGGWRRLGGNGFAAVIASLSIPILKRGRSCATDFSVRRETRGY